MQLVMCWIKSFVKQTKQNVRISHICTQDEGCIDARIWIWHWVLSKKKESCITSCHCRYIWRLKQTQLWHDQSPTIPKSTRPQVCQIHLACCVVLGAHSHHPSIIEREWQAQQNLSQAALSENTSVRYRALSFCLPMWRETQPWPTFDTKWTGNSNTEGK